MDEVVAETDELSDGDRIFAQVDGKEIAVFNVDGEYYACVNWCPHQAGPICEGMLTGTTGASFDRETLEYDMDWVDDGKIAICPWHGWEFDVTTGEATHDDDIQLITYPVRVEDGSIVVSL